METRILWQAENRANDADFEGVTETYAAMLKFAHQVARPIPRSRCATWTKRRVRLRTT